MEFYEFYCGRGLIGGKTEEEDCNTTQTWQEAKAWLMEELEDGFRGEELPDYEVAINALADCKEGENFFFIVGHFTWFIKRKKKVYNDFMCCIIGGKLDARTFPNPGKCEGILEVAKKYEAAMKETYPDTSVYLARITQIL